MRTSSQLAGDKAEDLAARHLAAIGWTVLARNVRAGRGELDIVAVDPGPPAELVIVEVRWRAGRSFGLAEETVAFRKRSHLRAATGRLLQDGLPGGVALPALPIRVDLVVVEPGRAAGDAPRIRHHKAAI